MKQESFLRNFPTASLERQDFTFFSSYDATGPLYATAIYVIGAKQCPIMVVQHGYSGNRSMVFYSAQRMAEQGFFCLCIETRGRGQSAGVRDDGGIEIMDIYDGINAAVTHFADAVDASRTSIIGYSNGGANVFFATVRFPFLFGASMALFGIPDYGYWFKYSPLDRDRTNLLASLGGDPTTLPEKYLARNAALAAANLSGTRFHIAFDEMETRCPNVMSETFYNAVNANGYDKIFMHISDRKDIHRFEHGYNTKGELSYIEDIFVRDIQQFKPGAPEMPLAGRLVVLGYVITPLFKLFINSGDDAVATLNYSFQDDKICMCIEPITTVNKITFVLDDSQQNKPFDLNIKNKLNQR